jgi:LCP family protein required for cell wall assembly
MQPPPPLPAWPWRSLATRFVTALAIISLAVTGGLAYAYWFANDLVSQAKKVPIPAPLIPHEKSTEPANYLIVGSDSRAFVHDKVAADHFGTQRTNPENLADVIMIAHVDPKTPGKGFLVSIPRDSWVPIPGHGTQKINAAFSYGSGPAVLIQTIESNFKITINHYMKLDFATFADVVNAIGHVNVFFPTQARDVETGLSITTPGCVALDGLSALAYARSRYYQYRSSSSDAWSSDQRSDLGRIQRQQYFIRSLAQQAIKAGARNPLTARAILEKIVPHLEVDNGMGLQQFLRLARAFRSVDPGSLQMVTVPTKSFKPTPKIQAQQVLTDQAAPIFALLGSFDRASKPASTAKIAPAKIRVQVLNGSNVKGIASSTAAALRSAGFASGGTPTDADQNDYQNTQVRYTPGHIDEARIVASYLGGVGILTPRTTGMGSADVVVVTGQDFVGIVTPGTHKQAPVPAAATTTPPNPGTTPGITAPKTVAGQPLVGCG